MPNEPKLESQTPGAESPCAGSDDGLASRDASPPIAYCRLPAVMKVYYQWNLSGREDSVCGSDERDRLFAVEAHTGRSMSGPLGNRQGFHLYNGTSTKLPILAAAGEESALGGFALNNISRILLPGFESKGLVTEMMRAYTTPKLDHGVAFRFSVETGTGEEMRRETFEWRKVKKGERDESMKNGGFKLFRLGFCEDNAGTGDSSQSVLDQAAGAQEVVAVFPWRGCLSSPKHPFDLELVGKDRSDTMGERWTLMVLTTALRIWVMHLHGKTHRGPLAVAEKVQGKRTSVPSGNLP
ncbi:hypothetical protein GGR57DRAFT_465160 [Xylariaceae sp. FL1272]|nr:hypothetical protein GGR57DRAFT_465160 [Xylariaceae sp. FL1272]